jgi:hypothetical protein
LQGYAVYQFRSAASEPRIAGEGRIRGWRRVRRIDIRHAAKTADVAIGAGALPEWRRRLRDCHRYTQSRAESDSDDPPEKCACSFHPPRSLVRALYRADSTVPKPNAFQFAAAKGDPQSKLKYSDRIYGAARCAWNAQRVHRQQKSPAFPLGRGLP